MVNIRTVCECVDGVSAWLCVCLWERGWGGGRGTKQNGHFTFLKELTTLNINNTYWQIWEKLWWTRTVGFLRDDGWQQPLEFAAVTPIILCSPYFKGNAHLNKAKTQLSLGDGAEWMWSLSRTSWSGPGGHAATTGVWTCTVTLPCEEGLQSTVCLSNWASLTVPCSTWEFVCLLIVEHLVAQNKNCKGCVLCSFSKLLLYNIFT